MCKKIGFCYRTITLINIYNTIIKPHLNSNLQSYTHAVMNHNWKDYEICRIK